MERLYGMSDLSGEPVVRLLGLVSEERYQVVVDGERVVVGVGLSGRAWVDDRVLWYRSPVLEDRAVQAVLALRLERERARLSSGRAGCSCGLGGCPG